MGVFNDHWEEEVDSLKAENATLRSRLNEVSAELVAVNYKLIDAEKKLPRLRYVDKDGMPSKEDGWCICVFRQVDGSSYMLMKSIPVLCLPHNENIYKSMIAWLPESEFINAFVEEL